jgi:hypothetical protein
VEIGTVAVQFFYLEYLFRIFGIGSLQCVENSEWQYCVFDDNFLYICIAVNLYRDNLRERERCKVRN